MSVTAAVLRSSHIKASLASALNADLTRPLTFAALAAVFLLVRAPFINYGHGTDPDAWRVAVTAHHLLDHGDYFPSRLPGNPLHEYVMTLFISGGWIATNVATALISLAGVYVFARIVAHLKLPSAAVLTVAFAFTPLLFINSIATMDYMWTLTAILGAYYSALKGQSLVAGLLIGCAIGFRLQSFIVLPAFAFLLWRQGQLRQLPALGLAAGGVAALVFAPVLVIYGTGFFTFYDAPVYYQDVIRLLGKEALGVIGGLGVLLGALVSIRRFASLPFDAVKDTQLAVWLIVIGTYFASFFRLPHEIAYLIPVFPFGLLLMARYFSQAALVGATVAIIVAGVVDITTPSDELNVSGFKSATIGRGLLLSNADTMSAQHDFVNEILRSPVPDHSVVMAGFVFPQLAVRERGRLDSRILQRDHSAISMLSDRGEAVDEQRDVRYVWLLTYPAFQSLRAQGYNFFLVPDAAGGTAALYYYRPQLWGASVLKLDRPAPSAAKGTASTDR
jgi:hypothetical protein